MADKNFGYEEKGPDGGSDICNYTYGSIFQILEDGIAKSITLYTSSHVAIKVAIYDASLNLLATGSGESGLDDWATVNLDTTPELTKDAYYWLVTRGGTGISDMAYKTEVGAGMYSSVGYFSFPADPLVKTGDLDRKFSIYCTYTPAGGGWSGKVAGVTDPTKVLGVEKANIKSVMGVE